MAHARLPDFIVTKKRKRSRLQAIDPCLGFSPAPFCSPRDASHLFSSQPCLDPQPTAITSFTEETVAHTSSPNLTHRALEQSDLVGDVYRPAVDHMQATANGVSLEGAPYPERVPREIEALTVEGFLRSATTIKNTKYYSNRRGGRNARKQCEPPPCNRRERQIKWTSDEEEYVPEEPAKKRQRRKKAQRTQPLSARLLSAAVVMGVDVVGGVLYPDAPMAHTSTVRPLPLGLGGRPPSPIDTVAKSRRRRFVDPRKVDRADSQFARVAEDASVKVKQVKKQRPITAWEPQGHAVPTLSLRNGPSGSGEYFVARPLTLVSSTHPHSALWARCTTIISRSCPIPKRRKNETPCGERGGLLKSCRAHSSPNLMLVTLDDPHTRGRASFGRNSSPHSSSTLDAQLLPCGNTRGDRDPADPSVIGDHTEITLCSAPNIPPPPVAIPSSSSLSRSTLDSNLDEVLPSRGSERPRSTHKLDPLIAFKLPPQSVPPKPLKSLGSLLNDLREIARNATQVTAASQARRSTPLWPATSSSREDRNPQAVRPASPSRSVLPLPPTAQSLPATGCARPVSSGAQTDVAPTQDFDEGGDSHPTFPKDCGTCDNSGCSVDAHPDIHRVDVLAILESNQRKAILLPSSPLPGWNTLPCSTIGARDSENSDYDDSY